MELVSIVGKLHEYGVETHNEENETYGTIKVAKPRDKKDKDGTYHADIIPIVMNKTMFENVKAIAKVGDIVGVKGRLECWYDGLVFVGTKVSCLGVDSREDDK